MSRIASGFVILLLALSVIWLAQCSAGTVQGCSEDSDCMEQAGQYCELSVQKCMPRICTPDCSGRECGPDPQNCGTSCGTCKLSDQHCELAKGRCEACSPDCGARVCGGVPNGCGESCGTCKDTAVCNAAAGSCEACRSDCGERVCGPVPNGCGESCGTCKDTQVCNTAAGSCEACSLDCGDRVCGPVPNGCGESCGDCNEPESCDTTNGRCEKPDHDLLFNGDFDTGDKSQYSVINTCFPNRISFDSQTTRGGHGYSARIVVYPGDVCNSAEAERMGIYLKNMNDGEGVERFYAFSIYLPSNFTLTAWTLLFQLVPKQSIGGLAPAMSLILNNMNYWSVGINNHKPPTYYYSINFPPVRGEWMDWIVHMKYSTSNNGFIKINYKTASQTEYTEVLSKTGIQTLQVVNGVTVPIAEMGINVYRGAQSITHVVYFDEVKIGTTFDSVKYAP